jgi:threonine dehydratase
VEEAAERVGGRVRETPVLALGHRALGDGALGDAEIILKLELLQHTGSFKLRGAFNKMLAADIGESGVVAASGGNFALAVARAAAELGRSAAIFVPRASPPAKVEALRRGAPDVVVVGEFYDDALEASRERAAESGALELHAFDDPLVVAGQGTCARELDRQTPDLDTVLVAVGGGGLAAGTCSWYTDRVRIVAVEPERAPTLDRALGAGRPVEVEVGGYAADSLGARRIGAQPWASFERWLDDAVLVDDGAIREAQRRLWTEARIAAEPGGAAAFAALLAGAYVPARGERVGVLVSGGNFDPSVLV